MGFPPTPALRDRTDAHRNESKGAGRPAIRQHKGVTQSAADDERHWTLLTNHGRLLLMIAQEPDIRIRDLAHAAGITERTAQTIVTDLEHAGYLTREKAGRRNTYKVNRRQPFRHQAESGHKVGELIDVFTEPEH